jgi:hypothetical protein
MSGTGGIGGVVASQRLPLQVLEAEQSVVTLIGVITVEPFLALIVFTP